MSLLISMQDLHQRLSGLGKNELVLDVREKEEFVEGHVPGSRNIPHQEVGKFAEELKKFDRVYVHCLKGGRAQVACKELEGLGLKNLVCIVNSGMKDWIQAGFEIQK